MKNIKELFENKKILILGYAREGKSTHKFIIDNNVSCETFIYDKRDISEELLDNNVTTVTFEYFLDNIDKFDIIMKTPGISLKDLDISAYKNKIFSQAEIFLKEYRNQIIGITGTKGKSTTSSLLYEVLKKHDNNTILCGNIGKPFFDVIKDIDSNTKIVCELSSHQLEFVEVSPRVAVVTNIYQEHLDHYDSYETYISIKKNVFKYQEQNDYFIYNNDIPYIEEKEIKSKIINVSTKKETMFHVKHSKIYKDNVEIFNEYNERNILGDNNLFNIMTVFALSSIYNIKESLIKDVIKEFKGLPHREEYVGIYNDIKFYNDSISTIPETCICAIENIPTTQTVIIGGLNRGVDYKELVDYLNNHLNLKVICMHETGKIIYERINNEKYYYDDLKEAVSKVFEITDKNKTCLFSPAAASYGFYKNFEERGEKFKEYIKCFM